MHRKDGKCSCFSDIIIINSVKASEISIPGLACSCRKTFMPLQLPDISGDQRSRTCQEGHPSNDDTSRLVLLRPPASPGSSWAAKRPSGTCNSRSEASKKAGKPRLTPREICIHLLQDLWMIQCNDRHHSKLKWWKARASVTPSRDALDARDHAIFNIFHSCREFWCL